MSCRTLHQSCEPAPLVHRLTCGECRRARRPDAAAGLAVRCMAEEPVPREGLVRTLRALDLDSFSAGRVRERSQVRLRRIVVRSSAVVATLTAAASLWLWWIDIDPNVRVHNPTMPSPNAYTYFRAAGLALQQQDDVAYALPGSASRAPTGTDGKPRTYTQADRERLLAANGEALRLMRAGFRHEYLEPPARSFDHLYPHYATYRGLARLLSLESAVHEAGGNRRNANESDLDAIDLGIRAQRGGTIIGMLVGDACEAMGRVGLWRRVDKLTARDAAAAARRLAAIEKRRVGAAAVLTEEKLATIAGLQEIMRRRGWRWNAGGIVGDGEGRGHWRVFLAMLPHSKRAIISAYARNLDAQISAAGARTWTPHPPVQVPGDPISEMLYPVFGQATFKDVLGQTQNGLLTVRLAVRAYEASRGRLPDTLDYVRRDGLLTAVPQDRFSPKYHALRYAVVNGKPVIYSVGPDGVDDGGAPIRTTEEGKPDQRVAVTADRRGDIVAGVNTW